MNMTTRLTQNTELLTCTFICTHIHTHWAAKILVSYRQYEKPGWKKELFRYPLPLAPRRLFLGGLAVGRCVTGAGTGYILNAYALMHWVINRNFYWSLSLQFTVSKIVRWAPAAAPGPPPAPNGQFCIPNGYIASIFSAQGPRIYQAGLWGPIIWLLTTLGSTQQIQQQCTHPFWLLLPPQRTAKISKNG